MFRHLPKFCVAVLLFASLAATAQGTPSAASEPQPPPDAKEIVSQALRLDERNFELARNYTCEQRTALKVLDRRGATKRDETNTYEITILYQEPYGRRILHNDKPLSGKDEKKEQDKLDKFVAAHKNETEKDREKRLAKQERARRESRAFVADILNAYDFRLLGEESVDGRATYVVEANPRKDFRPTQPHADILSKLRGTMWIDKEDYHWARVEAESLETISWGLFLLRIHKGSQLSFRQVRVNNEIWLPQRIQVNASSRFALLFSSAFQWETTFSSYKKFRAETQILPGVQEPEPQQPQ
ncbi:MAG: hypothetical protein LAO06_02720 [Acidobacteriia bacterium]|nr:hypothetical protein [Terriglobia bacterium]